MRLTRLFGIAAIGLSLVLAGCGPSIPDAPDLASYSTPVAEASMIASLDDGLHQVNFPTGPESGQSCMIIKDRGYKAGYLVNLGCEETDNPQYEFNTIAEGSIISTLSDGVHDIEIDGQHFEDGQDRTCTIAKDRGYKAGYATNLGCRTM